MSSRAVTRTGPGQVRPAPDAEDDVTRAEALARRFDRPMGALGVLFVLVVLGQTVATDAGLLGVLSVLAWLLWAAFVAELVLRAAVAGDQRRFWRRNWWQVVFLALPFLRLFRTLYLLRALRVARVARVGAVLSSAVRGSRSAGRLLTGRLSWLGVVTSVVVLASSQLLHLLGAYDSYGSALHDAAMATVTGEPLGAEGALARGAEVLLAIYSVVVFAALAGSLGAYFLEREGDRRAAAGTTDHLPVERT